MITKISQSIYVYKAKCLWVKDGDTVEAELDLGFKVKWTTPIRFHGIDTYEIHGVTAHPTGSVAKKFLEDMFAKFGDVFYFKSERDEIAIYNRAAGSLWLETKQGGKRAFVDVVATMKANGFLKDGSVPLNAGDPIYIYRIANDIMDVFV